MSPPKTHDVPAALALMKAAPDLYRELYELNGEVCVRQCPTTGHLDDCLRRIMVLASARPPAPPPKMGPFLLKATRDCDCETCRSLAR